MTRGIVQGFARDSIGFSSKPFLLKKTAAFAKTLPDTGDADILRHMKSKTLFFDVSTRGKGLYEVTAQVRNALQGTSIQDGVVTVFVRHTSASLVIFENADPTASRDLEKFFERLVPEDADGYSHTLEGPDDMTSHIRMSLTRTSEVIPVSEGRMVLGTWQGIFLFEHRRTPHVRQVAVNISGC
jgi:secondary thiamine-phosphate synthase enzyme